MRDNSRQYPLQMMVMLADQNPDTWILNLSLDWVSDSALKQSYLLDSLCTAADSGRLIVLASGNKNVMTISQTFCLN